MNLHKIVSKAIGTVNPNIPGHLKPSIGGYVTDTSGKRTPVYGPIITRMMQVQALTTNDLQKLEKLNVQGSTHAIYVDGDLEGVVRPEGKGGDIITLDNGEIYLVTQILERWPDWTKASVTLQRA